VSGFYDVFESPYDRKSESSLRSAMATVVLVLRPAKHLKNTKFPHLAKGALCFPARSSATTGGVSGLYIVFESYDDQ
jgi:hypothetical protein